MPQSPGRLGKPPLTLVGWAQQMWLLHALLGAAHLEGPLGAAYYSGLCSDFMVSVLG